MEDPDPTQRRGRRLGRWLLILGLAAVAAAGCERRNEGGGRPPAPTIVAPFAVAHSDLDAALTALGDAPAQGFAPDAFGDIAQISAQLRSGDADQVSQGRDMLRKALVAYALAEHGLGLPRDQFPKEWGIRPPPYDASADLDQAIDDPRFAAWLTALPPQEPRYRALVQALASYRAAANHGGWVPIPDGPALRRGARGARVEALRARLGAEDPSLQAQNEGPSAPQDAATGTSAAQSGAPTVGVYDAALAAAVAQAQARYGLKPTGAADRATIEALNVPIAARVNQIRANLERWRWLPRPLPATRVEVDAASGSMDYYLAGRPALHMLAAAGKPDDKTPMLVSAITQVEFNPPWRVPADIVRKELYPKEARDHGYLRRNHFVRGISAAAPLVQEPGPKSALGEVKFEFDNPYGVYLHDTPAKGAFEQAQRQVSHGCVRLERATDLAKTLLTPSGWPPQQVDQAIAGQATSTVKLSGPTPVLLLYWTALVLNGKMNFREDFYGWDAVLVGLLDASPTRRA